MSMFKSKGMIRGAVVAAMLVVGVAGVNAFQLPGFGKFQKAEASKGVVTIPAAKVSDGKAHYFKFEDKGKDISFFIVKGSDGALHTAFDACDSCYRAKKGYEQKGDFMVCKNCNMRFASAKIGPHAVGGCNPSHLASTVAGGNVIIKASDLQAGAQYF